MKKAILFIVLILVPSLLTAQETSYLNVLTDFEDFYLIIDNDVENRTYHREDTLIELSSGIHILEFVFQNQINSPKKTFTFTAGDTLAVSIQKTNSDKNYNPLYVRFSRNINLSILSEEGALIKIDGQIAGQSQADLLLDKGKYELTVELDGISKKSLVNIDSSYSHQVIALPLFPKKNISNLLLPIPGAKLIYEKSKTKGYLLLGSSLAMGLTSLSFNNRYNSEFDKYELLQLQYSLATDPNVLNDLATQAQSHLDRANELANRRDITLYSFLGIYALHLYSGLRHKPATGYSRNLRFEPFISPNSKSMGFKLSGRIK